MCAFCEGKKTILEKEIVNDWIFGWMKEVKPKDLIYDNLGVFIDRGYLRMADLDDCQCLESGQKIKINYCLFCGKEV